MCLRVVVVISTVAFRSHWEGGHQGGRKKKTDAKKRKFACWFLHAFSRLSLPPCFYFSCPHVTAIALVFFCLCVCVIIVLKLTSPLALFQPPPSAPTLLLLSRPVCLLALRDPCAARGQKAQLRSACHSFFFSSCPCVRVLRVPQCPCKTVHCLHRRALLRLCCAPSMYVWVCVGGWVSGWVSLPSIRLDAPPLPAVLLSSPHPYYNLSPHRCLPQSIGKAHTQSCALVACAGLARKWDSRRCAIAQVRRKFTSLSVSSPFPPRQRRRETYVCVLRCSLPTMWSRVVGGETAQGGGGSCSTGRARPHVCSPVRNTSN